MFSLLHNFIVTNKINEYVPLKVSGKFMPETLNDKEYTEDEDVNPDDSSSANPEEEEEEEEDTSTDVDIAINYENADIKQKLAMVVGRLIENMLDITPQITYSLTDGSTYGVLDIEFDASLIKFIEIK